MDSRWYSSASRNVWKHSHLLHDDWPCAHTHDGRTFKDSAYMAALQVNVACMDFAVGIPWRHVSHLASIPHRVPLGHDVI